MTQTLWPRFLKRGKEGEPTYEEKVFPSPEAVPAGDGWEMITPPPAQAASGDAAKGHRIAQAEQALAAERRARADDLEHIAALSAYAVDLEQFAADLAALPDAPPEVAARVDALLAASPVRLAQGLGGDSPGETQARAKGKGKGKI